MHRQEPLGTEWSVNTLQRATRLGQKTLARAAERKVEWPKQNWQKTPQEDTTSFTTLDEAFDTVAQFMSQTTRQCRRYHNSHPPGEREEAAQCHCDRFHTPHRHKVATSYRHPLQRSGNVEVIVPPGSYAVSACPWSSSVPRTHVVHVQQDQTVDLDFVL